MKPWLLFPYVVAAALLLPSESQGQPFALGRGSCLVSGCASYSNTEYKKDFRPGAPASEAASGSRYAEYRFNPGVLFFVLPGLAVGGELNLSRFSSDGNAVHTYRLGPALRYYLWGPEKKAHPDLAAAVSAAITDSPHSDYTQSGYRAAGGGLFLLSPAVGLNGEIFYDVNRTGVTHEGSGLKALRIQWLSFARA